MTSSTAIQLAAGKIRGNLQADSTATRLHSYGVSQVLLRDWAQASLALAAAAREQPKNARYQSDVAALYLERVRNGQRPGDLIKALAAAERARLADPRLPEAWFNRALALEQLSLRGQARAAWADYLVRDHSSAWADEARAHIAALDVPVAASRWPSVEARLRTGVDAALAEEAIRVQATEARTFFETVLWPGWAAAVIADGPATSSARRCAPWPTRSSGSPATPCIATRSTAVDHAERQGPVALRARSAAAHAAYAEAASLARQDLFSAAVPKLTRRACATGCRPQPVRRAGRRRISPARSTTAGRCPTPRHSRRASSACRAPRVIATSSRGRPGCRGWWPSPRGATAMPAPPGSRCWPPPNRAPTWNSRPPRMACSRICWTIWATASPPGSIAASRWRRWKPAAPRACVMACCSAPPDRR